ncbi:MAG: ferritin family protein [Deltaproteobacteria bacterium]|nr:ferritin family protein [Deltaproteobacteria bacterium]
MEFFQEKAILTAIAIEIRSLSFYRSMSSKVDDIHTRRFFELLAVEEADQLNLFCKQYSGNDGKLVDILVKNNMYSYPYYCSMLNSVGCHTSESDALQIALKEEQACIDCYTEFMEEIQEQTIREIFESILKEARKHCELISEEYMRLMGSAEHLDYDYSCINDLRA